MSRTAHHRTLTIKGRLLPLLALATLLLILVPATQAGADVDLRSPDTRDAAAASEAAQGVDLRSPDTRDAAREAASPAAAPARSEASSSDFSWGYLALSGLGLMVLAGLLQTARRRRRRTAASPA